MIYKKKIPSIRQPSCFYAVNHVVFLLRWYFPHSIGPLKAAAFVSYNMAAPEPSRCCFFVQKKKRFCKMVAGKGRKYCGEHATMVSSRIQSLAQE